MRVLYISENRQIEQLFIEFLGRAIEPKKLDILLLSRDTFKTAFTCYDCIIIPFTPCPNTPFGKWLEFFLSNGQAVVCSNWFQLDTPTELEYRSDFVKYFAKLGLNFMSWTTGSDMWLGELVSKKQVWCLKNYLITEKQLRIRDTKLSKFVVVLAISECFWSREVVRYKIKYGYNKDSLEQLIAFQFQMLKKLPNVINELQEIYQHKHLEIYATCENLYEHLLGELGSVKHSFKIKLLDCDFFSDTLPLTSHLFLSSPLLGLEEDHRAIKLFYGHKYFDLTKVGRFNSLLTFDSKQKFQKIRLKPSTNLKKNLRKTQNIDHYLNSKKIENLKIKVFFQFKILSKLFFWHIVFYNLKSHLKSPLSRTIGWLK